MVHLSRRGANDDKGTGGWALLVFLIGAAASAGCIGNRPKACSFTSDCPSGAICDGRGFCAQECISNRDCPCGSSCVASCGLCMRTDNGTPATCFTADHEIGLRDALGACGPAVTRSLDGGSADAGGRVINVSGDDSCLPVPLMCTVDAAAVSPGDAAPNHPADAADAVSDGHSDATDGETVQ